MLTQAITRATLATALCLSVPLVAMQVSDEMAWSAFDVVFMGVLLFGTVLAYQLVARIVATPAYALAVGVALVAGFLLVWVNAAVGIIGAPGGPNTVYWGVLALGLAGAAAARLRPLGMARTLVAMALAQMAVPLIALMLARDEILAQPPGVWGVVALNAVFAALFVTSAALFQRASGVAVRAT
jgi:hypothetical protein